MRGGVARALAGLAWAVAALVALLAWSFASPPVSSPDEDYHLGSIWCPPPAEASGCQLGTKDGKPAVFVPEAIAERPCYVGKTSASAACVNALSDTTLVPSTRFDQGDYPGPYYRIMHGFVGPEVDRTVLTIRAVNSAVAVLFIGLALALAPAASRRAATYAVAVGVVPLGMFMMGSVNPSAWSFVGLTACWIALNSLARARSVPARVANGALALAGAGLAAVARADTAPFIVIIVAAVGLVHLTLRPRWEWLVAAAGALAIGAWSFLTSAQSSGVAPTAPGGPVRPRGWVLGYNLTENLQVAGGVLGVPPWGSLGWLELPMPTGVYVPMLLLAGALLFVGPRLLDWRKAGALLIVAVGLTALPFYMLQRNLDTAGIQPRYFMSLVPLLLGIALLAPRARDAYRLTVAQALVAWVFLNGAHAIALLTVLRRFTTGTAGSYRLGTNVTWWWDFGPGPLQWWVAGVAGFAVASSAVVWVSFRRRVPPPAAARGGAPGADAEAAAEPIGGHA